MTFMCQVAYQESFTGLNFLFSYVKMYKKLEESGERGY